MAGTKSSYRALIAKSILLAVTSVNTVLAAPHPKPERCPDVVDLISAGFDLAAGSTTAGWWVVNQKNSYHTSQQWTFIMYLGADNLLDAVTKANTLVPRVKFNDTEMKPIKGGWSCDTHEIDPNQGFIYMASAMTPPIKIIAEPSEFKIGSTS